MFDLKNIMPKRKPGQGGGGGDESEIVTITNKEMTFPSF